ncbi:MAG TPA: oligosaccharide flippase family protein [Patescibacteria group bacterium]|nr:oligosaccharide flippase family protein [Patescibacteria group bacterium]
MKKIKGFISNPLIFGSSVILIGSLAANLGHYMFNLIMGRWLLTPSQYGLVVSLVSVTVLFSVFQLSLTGIFAKFSAKFAASKDKVSESDLIKKGLRLTFIISFAILIILLISSSIFSEFLHVNNYLIVSLTFLYIFLSILSSLPMGILQGQVRVYVISFLNIFNALVKLGVGVGLVLLGYQVFGAMVGIGLSIFAMFVLAMFFIRKNILKSTDKREDEQKLLVRELQKYGVKFFLATLGITMFTSMDIILARHFFSPIIAGQYAALALMGKAIFYLTFPIYFVFFPLVAQKKEKKEKVHGLLVQGAILIVIVSVLSSIFYFLYPNIVLKVFFPKPEYAVLSKYLGIFSIFILIYSVANLFNNFLLSIGKTNIYIINLFCAFLMVVLISIYHSDLIHIIHSLIATSFLLLLLLFIYYLNNGKD